MGLFRRREAPAEPAASPEPAEPAVAPADPGPPAWATLPPLTPTISVPAPTFKIGSAVKDDLVALDSPRLSHGMGHLVSSDGPPGVISGLARTTVQRQASTSSGGPLDMPMAPSSAETEPEPAAASTVFVPGLVPGGDGGSGAWSPPASPISAAAAAPPPSRELTLAPTIQRQADPEASAFPEDEVPVAPDEPAPAPAAEPEPSAAPPVAGPSDPTPPAAATVPRASTEPAGAAPTVPRARSQPTGATEHTTSVPTVQRAGSQPTGTTGTATSGPTVPRASSQPTGATGHATSVPAVQRASSQPIGSTATSAALAGAEPTGTTSVVQRASTEPAGVTATATPVPTVEGASTEPSLTLAPSIQRADREPTDIPSLTLPTAPQANVQRQGAELPDLTLPTAQHNAAVPAPPRPRPGAVGPPLETRALHAPMALQRSADGPAAAVPAGAVPVSEPAAAPLGELAIRQRPHPTVQRQAEPAGAVLRPAAAEAMPDAGASLPLTSDPSGRTASPPPAPELEPEAEAEAEPSFPLPLAPAVGRGEAPDAPVVGQSGAVGFVPLVAQRSFSGPA
ncbi:MAG TPA: hypothetical protein VFB94_24110, partial [Acidimicrobiales bacterium]|nr:hypothetical protein [Acidimicrobiales bacterium]